MSVHMNAAESSIALEQPIRSGPRVWFKRFCPPTPNTWSRRTIAILYCLGSLTVLAFFIWFLSALRWGPPTTSEPATEVGPPTTSEPATEVGPPTTSEPATEVGPPTTSEPATEVGPPTTSEPATEVGPPTTSEPATEVGPPTTSEPATEVGPPTAGATVPDRGRVVGPSRVVGGEEAKPNDWPWQVSLQKLWQGSFRHFCGATLINKRWAMTAAHCVEEPESELRAVVGEHELSSVSGREQVVNATEVHIHPKWNGYVGEGNDIALLRFDSDVILNQWVQPAALPPAGQILPHNTTCYVTGWGLTDSGPTDRLMQAYLPLVDHQTCSRAEWWGRWVKNTMVCAGGNGIQAGCLGDSGGPLNCDVNSTHVVHGVTSFGIQGCKQSKKPTVFTRVSAYIDWMDQIIN